MFVSSHPKVWYVLHRLTVRQFPVLKIFKFSQSKRQRMEEEIEIYKQVTEVILGTTLVRSTIFFLPPELSASSFYI